MQAWIARWRELHPDWTHNLWRDVDATTIEANGEQIESCQPKLLRNACHYSQRSNIWRYELIFRQGGVYLDTDMEPRANIDHVLAGHDAFIASQWRADLVSGACFGAQPAHPWIVDALTTLGTRDPRINLSMGDQLANDVYRRHQKTVHRTAPDVFLFFAHRRQEIVDRLITPETVAVHRCSCFWYPTGYVPLI